MNIFKKLKTEIIIVQVYYPFQIVGNIVTVDVVVKSGEDPNPGLISLGPQNSQGCRVDLAFSGGLPGVVYEVFVNISIAGDLLTQSFLLAVDSDYADTSPDEYVPVDPVVVLPELSAELALRSTLYPIEGPREYEGAMLTFNSIDVVLEVITGTGFSGYENAMLAMNSIDVWNSVISGENQEYEDALLVLNSIEVRHAILGDMEDFEDALLELTDIVVKTEPNGSDTLHEDAMLTLNSITVETP